MLCSIILNVNNFYIKTTSIFILKCRYTMAKRTYVLIRITGYTRARQQMNQIVRTAVQYIHHSVEPQPSVYHADGQQISWWSVNQDSPSRCALSLRSSRLENGTRYTLLQSPPYSAVNRVHVRATDDCLWSLLNIFIFMWMADFKQNITLL